MSRRDDINKLYQPSKALEKVCYALFTADIAISLIAACVGGSVISYLTVALVIIAFLYMAISIIDDGIMWFQAESARRKNSIQVAYDVRLDEYETEKYYNNNVGDPDPSYGLLCILDHSKLLFIAEGLQFKHVPVVALTKFHTSLSGFSILCCMDYPDAIYDDAVVLHQKACGQSR